MGNLIGQVGSTPEETSNNDPQSHCLKPQNTSPVWVGVGSCDCRMLTFSSLLQKASNFPNIYISETSKDFSPEDSKICFLVLWKDVWYSLKRKMQSYKRIGKREGEKAWGGGWQVRASLATLAPSAPRTRLALLAEDSRRSHSPPGE